MEQNIATRLQAIQTALNQKRVVTILHLLQETRFSDFDLIYDPVGKPHLKNGPFISITHSFTFTGIILSENQPVGIDIEKQREKILKIAHKFTPLEEYKTIANAAALIRKLTIVWGAKESLYKIYGKKKLLFLHHLPIADFKFEDKKTTGAIHYHGTSKSYQIEFLEFEDFTCVFAY